MLRVISRVNFRKSNTTYFETVSADPPIPTVSEPPITRRSLKPLIVIKLQVERWFYAQKCEIK